MPEGNPLAIFAPGLNALGVPWMTVGSIASSAYGERRTTLDLDVVAMVGRHDVARFLAVFAETEFYCPPAEIIETESARPERGHFNLIHQHSIWLAKHRFGSLLRSMSSFTKLEFYREGGSEKHLRDIRGMLAVTDVDRAFLEKEIGRRGLGDLWQKCL